MKLLALNGSPRKDGTVATLLRAVADGARDKHDVEWLDLYDHDVKPCIACMNCRPDGECILPEDGAHQIGRRIRAADGLIVGTPTHWGNMSAMLKLILDRNVPALMGEKPNGFPEPRHRGQPAAVVIACTTPWPFNFVAAESRGAYRAVKEVLHYGGYKLLGKVVKPGTKKAPDISPKILDQARKLGRRF